MSILLTLSLLLRCRRHKLKAQWLCLLVKGFRTSRTLPQVGFVAILSTFNFRQPRMFNIQSRCSTLSPKVLKHLATLTAQLDYRPKYQKDQMTDPSLQLVTNLLDSHISLCVSHDVRRSACASGALVHFYIYYPNGNTRIRGTSKITASLAARVNTLNGRRQAKLADTQFFPRLLKVSSSPGTPH